MGDSPCFSPRRPCHRRTFPLAVSSTFTRRGRLRGVPSLVARPSRRAFRTSPSNPGMVRKRRLVTSSNARFTLADPMPRLGSDVVGGNSGRNHPTSRRHTIHIGRMARNVSIHVGWYEGVVQYCTTPWLVR